MKEISVVLLEFCKIMLLKEEHIWDLLLYHFLFH